MNEETIAKIVASVLENAKTDAVQHMTLKLANTLIEKVQERARQMKVDVVVAVSDAAGRPVSIQCMDGAFIASYDVALNKTFTSASLKMSTDELSRLAQPGEPLYGIQHTNEGKIVIFGGGSLS